MTKHEVPYPFVSQLRESARSLRMAEMMERDGLAEMGRSRIFDLLPAGRFRVSVQASRKHYCIPRETYTYLEMYAAWEVWCGPQGDTLRALGITDPEILEYFGHDESEPAAGVPTAIVQKYLDALAALPGDGPEIT